MRVRLMFLQLLVLTICVVQQSNAAQQPASQPSGASANVRSPEVAADRSVTFRVAAPKASAVSISCECLTASVRTANEGERAMTRDSSGLWTLTIPAVEPEIYAYHFTVDGFGMLDPRNPTVKYSGRPGLIESILEVPGASAMFYDVKPVPHGKVDIRYYESKATGSTRRVFVYTPPGYEKSTAKLPVLYLLHGAGGDETVWTNFGRAHLILDNLIAEKKAQPMLVVMPNAYAYPPIANVPNDKQRADFEKDLIENLIPFVQANYRTAADRDHRALAGLSSGGDITLTIGPHHVDTFSRLASFSGLVRNFDSMKDVAANAKTVNGQLKLLWIATGEDDSTFANIKKSSDFFTTAGIKNTFKAIPGAHTYVVWRRLLHEVVPQLWSSSSGTN
jgi:enterochelin esterase-like enzyme